MHGVQIKLKRRFVSKKRLQIKKRYKLKSKKKSMQNLTTNINIPNQTFLTLNECI